MHRLNVFGRLSRVGRFDLQDQRVDVSGTQLRVEVRHTALSMSDDCPEVIDRFVGDFIGNQRWHTKMPAVGSLAMTLRAILFEYGI